MRKPVLSTRKIDLVFNLSSFLLKLYFTITLTDFVAIAHNAAEKEIDTII